MPRNFKDKVTLSGFAVLSIGLVLLVITFASAFGFLSEALPILTSQDLVQTFGETLAPLIASSIRIMYLGVMGWIGSLVTIRGVTLIANAPKTEAAELPKPQETKTKKSQAQPQPAEEKIKLKTEKPDMTKPVSKSGEPDLVLIPPDEIEQQTQQPQH